MPHQEVIRLANVLQWAVEQVNVIMLALADGSPVASMVALFAKPATERHQQNVNILARGRKTIKEANFAIKTTKDAVGAVAVARRLQWNKLIV